MTDPLTYRSPTHLHMHDEYPYTKDILADVRAKGFPAYLCPHPLHTSASRLGMLSKHITQAIPVVGSDFIKTFTGWEQDLKKYTFNESVRKDNGQVLAVIPKYNLAYRGTKTPFYVVVYKREKDGVIDMFTIDRYHKLSDGWGYKNEWNPKLNDLISENIFLEKDTILTHSPNIKDGRYGIGRNAKVAYLSMPFTKEDGIGVSKSFAKEFTSLSVVEILANVRHDYIPIDLYGTKDNPKFFPNIGDRIRSDGIICAFRPVTVERFAGDAAPEYLSEVDPLADITFVGPSNGIIADVDFLVNRQKRQQAYPQVRIYQDALVKYYKTILDLYNDWRKEHKFSPVFEDLVTEAITMLSGLGVDLPGIKLPSSAPIKDRKKHVVDFMQIRFTCVSEVPFGLGSKISDLQGAKGTIASIIDDEDMPVDAYGNRAEVIMEPNSPVKRTNYGALYEPTENFITDLVWRKVKEYFLKGDIDAAFDTLIDICNDWHPSYANLIKELYDNDLKKEFLAEIVDYGCIPINITQGLRTINTENLERICEKWGVKITPVTFNWTDGKGGKVKVTTSTPCVIGSKYFIRLCKEAAGMSAGISAVSHYGTPIRPHQSKKYSSVIRQTPVRWGEDETNIITMAVKISEVLRLQRLTSKSPAGVNRMIEELVQSPHPTQIERFSITDEELCRTDTIVGLFKHLNDICGVDVYHTAMTEEEKIEMLNLPEFDSSIRTRKKFV